MSPPPRAEAADPLVLPSRLLVSKLRPPVQGAHILPRPRLDERFAVAAPAKLVLIRAPAGFGKTTVMLRWLARAEETGRVAAWLDLDERDNDPGRFLFYLRAALAGVAAEFAGSEAGRFEEGAQPPAAGLLNLLEAIARCETSFALFLDNAEAVQNPEVFRVIRQVLGCLSPSHLLVMATRDTPDIGIARMRARGEMVGVSGTLQGFIGFTRSVGDAARFHRF